MRLPTFLKLLVLAIFYLVPGLAGAGWLFLPLLHTRARNCTRTRTRNCQGSIDFEKTKTVKVEYNRFNRKVCEALEIELNKCGSSGGGKNLDKGQYVDTKFWTPFFDYVRKEDIK